MFDYDGTLSKRYEGAYRMYRYMLHTLRPDVDETSLAFEAAVQRCLLWDEFGTISKEKHVFTLMKEHFAPDLDPNLWQAVWLEKFAEFQVLNPGVRETLAALKEKYKLGILSNGDDRCQRKKIQHTGVDAYFDVIVTSGQYGIQKPKKRIFEITAEKMGMRTDEIAFVGDTFATDITGAIHAGMKPVWFLYERKGIADYPVMKAASYEELRHILLEDTSWMQ